MSIKKYETFNDQDHLTYQFISEGPKGSIVKIILYAPIDLPGLEKVYNLGFGDLGSDNQISDVASSNNGDMDKVLATVANTVFDFFKHHPGASIFAKGSTEIRTKLYQRKLLQLMDILSTEFEVYGLGEKGWEEFTGHQAYQGFLIKQK